MILWHRLNTLRVLAIQESGFKKSGFYIAYGFQKDISKGMFGVMKSIMRFMIKKITTPDIKFLSPQLRDNNINKILIGKMKKIR